MSQKFTFLQGLPDILKAAGFNVEVADLWEYGQSTDNSNYLWTDPHTNTRSYDGKPNAYMVHHTGSLSATPPPHDTSKANAWIGLLRDGRLYQNGGWTPTIYLASAGPARISSGYGHRPAAWGYTFTGRRAPAKAEGSDGDTALNRYAFNAEVVHCGDGSPLDVGVRACVVGLGVALEQMTGLGEMTLGHRSWTRRKIDPYWDGDPDCIITIQDAIKEGHDMPNDCPWDLCDRHYTPPTSLVLGIGKDEHQGQCNVPDSQHASVIWAFDNIYSAGNQHRYDYDAPLTEGRNQVFEYRQR